MRGTGGASATPVPAQDASNSAPSSTVKFAAAARGPPHIFCRDVFESQHAVALLCQEAQTKPIISPYPLQTRRIQFKFSTAAARVQTAAELITFRASIKPGATNPEVPPAHPAPEVKGARL